MVIQVSAFSLKSAAQQNLLVGFLISTQYKLHCVFRIRRELPIYSFFCWKNDFSKTEVLWYLKADSDAEPRTCSGCSIVGSSYARTHCLISLMPIQLLEA